MKVRIPPVFSVIILATTVASLAAGQTAPLAPTGPSSSPTDSPVSSAPSAAPPVASQEAATTPLPAPSAPTNTAPTTAAPTEPVFGDRGEYVISGAFFVSLGHLGYSSSTASTTSVTIQPSLDYFVSKNVLFGGAIYLSHSDGPTNGIQTVTNTYGAYLHVGANLSLGTGFSWRPVVSIGVWNQHATMTFPMAIGVGEFSLGYDFAPVESSETVVVAEIFAPFLVHPARHFFLGLGPDFFQDLSNTTGSIQEHDRTFIGVSSIVGGWFGGDSTAP